MWAIAVVGAIVLWASPIAAQTDESQADESRTVGRHIYSPERTFGGVVEQRDRRFIAEVAVGLAAEGNLAAGFAVRVPRFGGLELWSHLGLAANPALHYSLSARYVFEFGSFRPYLGIGVTLADLYALGTLSTHLFAEVGHQFAVSSAYRISASVGVRGVLDVWLKSGSSLLDGTTDARWVDQELADARGAFVILTLRFSRRF